MHKIIILFFILLATLQVKSNDLDSISKGFWINTQVGLSVIYDALNKSTGFIAKGNKEFLNTNYFEGHAGFAFQFCHQNEKDMLINSGIEGFTNDIGFYTIFNFKYYPFKRKTLLFGVEPFVGITNLRSRGTLELPKYDISESYFNSYTYINYGLIPKVGYDFGRICTDLFLMISLKGGLDNGRNRFGDMDSRILFGISISYKLKQSE